VFGLISNSVKADAFCDKIQFCMNAVFIWIGLQYKSYRSRFESLKSE